ncbi:MAG: hypothetical protein WC635_11250 [Bacteriovorax sp.]|jgi:hypothetical protein
MGPYLTESGRAKPAKEGRVTKVNEKQKATLSSGFFISAAAGAVALSLGLALAKKKNMASFVGQWVPTILLLGIYDNALKTQSSGRESDKSSFLH